MQPQYGNFIIKQRIPQYNYKNTQCFRVQSVKEPKQQCKAYMLALGPRQTFQDGLENILKRNDPYIIEELSLYVKRERLYIMSVRNEKKIRSKNINLKNLKFSRSTCKRLMVQTLNLAQNLQQAGVSTDFSLEDCLNVTSQNNNHYISMIKVAPITHDDEWFLYFKREGMQIPQSSDMITMSMRIQLNNFFKKLMNCIPPIVSKGHTIYFKHHETDEFFSTILDTNLAFTLDALHTMLYRTNITWSDGSLFVKYHPGYNEIHLQLWTKKKGDLRDHYYKDYVELENTDKVLRVDQFYYMISMKYAQEVMIMAKYTLGIWDQGQWIMAKINQEGQYDPYQPIDNLQCMWYGENTEKYEP